MHRKVSKDDWLCISSSGLSFERMNDQTWSLPLKCLPFRQMTMTCVDSITSSINYGKGRQIWTQTKTKKKTFCIVYRLGHNECVLSWGYHLFGKVMPRDILYWPLTTWMWSMAEPLYKCEIRNGTEQAKCVRNLDVGHVDRRLRRHYNLKMHIHWNSLVNKILCLLNKEEKNKIRKN